MSDAEIVSAKLKESAEKEYADFQAKIVPNIPREEILGVRVPNIRALAGRIVKSVDFREFFKKLPHDYYEENMLHVILLEYVKDYDECLAEIERFLPYMNCWAVTDNRIPKILVKNRDRVIERVREWIKSDKPYICRYGVHMLMALYLDDAFRPEYNELVAIIRSEEYYVNMMKAWYFATALAKQWDATVPYIENRRLDDWTHNKTIQKAVESYRITDGQKAYLRTLKVRRT